VPQRPPALSHATVGHGDLARQPTPPRNGRSQVVILGAGLDLRVWRLPWLDATAVYEVDSGTIEAFKSAQMVGAAAKAPSCRRVFVQADIGDTAGLEAALEAAGLDATQPTLWVIEGLVGYLTAAESSRLFEAMLGMSAAASQVVMTTPPTLDTKADSERRGQQLHHKTFEHAETTLAR
jgi:methyltransferase (TIGR00027 family)